MWSNKFIQFYMLFFYFNYLLYDRHVYYMYDRRSNLRVNLLQLTAVGFEALNYTHENAITYIYIYI